MVGDRPPTSPCPVIRLHFGGVRIGATTRTETDTERGGVLVGMRSRPAPVRTHPSGFVIGGTAPAFLVPPRVSYGGIIIGARPVIDASAPTCHVAYVITPGETYSFVLSDPGVFWVKHVTTMPDDLGTWKFTYSVEVSDEIEATSWLQATGFGPPFDSPCDLEVQDERTEDVDLPSFDVTETYITGIYFSIQNFGVGHPVTFTVRLDKLS